MNDRTLAVVVSYMPEAESFRDLLHALLPQVGSVLVVDNTPLGSDRAVRVVEEFPRDGKLKLLRLGENLGVAAALNAGIRHAMEDGWDYVLMSDQDSLPAADMVNQLHLAAQSIAGTGVRVGCVNPLYVDQVTGQAFGFQVQEPARAFYSVVPGENANPWIEVISGISSGSLVPTAAFQEVGLMREDYFIDFVDTEWFHRARFHGYSLFGTSKAVLAHREGEFSFPVWYLRWRRFAGYSPQRLYYRFRNFVALCREPHVPPRWKLRAGWYWMGTAYAFLLFSPGRLANARYIALGIWHGILKRMGRLDG